MRLHIQRRQCQFCPDGAEGFLDEGELWAHIRSEHRDQLPFLCKSCPKAYETVSMSEHRLLVLTFSSLALSRVSRNYCRTTTGLSIGQSFPFPAL